MRDVRYTHIGIYITQGCLVERRPGAGAHMHDVCHGNELGGTADAAEQRVGNGPKWLVAVYYSLPGARTEGNDAMGRQTKTFVNRPWLNVCHLKNYMVAISWFNGSGVA